MAARNTAVEAVVKSFPFSLLLSLFCAFLTINHIRALWGGFDLTELLWLIYNATASVLFLIRVAPSAVSMNPVHWLVALVTSFSGWFFLSEGDNSSPVLLHTAESLVLFALLVNIAAALTLGRSFDFLPALRRVRTGWLYRIVRHPMYLSAIIVKVGYVLKHPSAYNALLLLALAAIYDRRARYEEEVLSRDESYAEYLRRVKYRFVPGIY